MKRCNQFLGGLKTLLRVNILLLLVVFLIIGSTSPALAADEAPDSVSLDNIVIFNGLLVAGDFLAVAPYEIPFTTPPDPNINETYIFRLLSADGSTDLGTITANPAYNGGYGQGIISFYIESGMVTGTAYIFRVQQNPAYYTSPQYWDFVADNTTYSEAADQALALAAKVIATAEILAPEYDVTLLDTTESGGTILSTYGELYYLNAIPGLQLMSPTLFSVQLTNPDYTQRSWSTTFADNIKTNYAGTIVEDFMTGYAGMFSLQTSPAMNSLSVVIFLIVVVISVWKFKATTLSALLDGYAVLLLLMLMGFFGMVWAGFIAFASAVIGGAIIFFKRA